MNERDRLVDLLFKKLGGDFSLGEIVALLANWTDQGVSQWLQDSDSTYENEIEDSNRRLESNLFRDLKKLYEVVISALPRDNEIKAMLQTVGHFMHEESPFDDCVNSFQHRPPNGDVHLQELMMMNSNLGVGCQFTCTLQPSDRKPSSAILSTNQFEPRGRQELAMSFFDETGNPCGFDEAKTIHALLCTFGEQKSLPILLQRSPKSGNFFPRRTHAESSTLFPSE